MRSDTYFRGQTFYMHVCSRSILAGGIGVQRDAVKKLSVSAVLIVMSGHDEIRFIAIYFTPSLFLQQVGKLTSSIDIIRLDTVFQFLCATQVGDCYDTVGLSVKVLRSIGYINLNGCYSVMPIFSSCRSSWSLDITGRYQLAVVIKCSWSSSTGSVLKKNNSYILYLIFIGFTRFSFVGATVTLFSTGRSCHYSGIDGNLHKGLRPIHFLSVVPVVRSLIQIVRTRHRRASEGECP